MKGKSKKEADEFPRENFEAGKRFIERCKKELGCEVKFVKVGRKDFTEEPRLYYKGKYICQICPRAECLFGQLGVEGNRRIHNKEEEQIKSKELPKEDKTDKYIALLKDGLIDKGDFIKLISSENKQDNLAGYM